MKVLSTQGDNLQKMIASEAASDDKWQKRWRPHFMYMCMFLIVNNFILFPYAMAFGLEVPSLTIPDQLWNILLASFGIIGGTRGLEKIVREYKK